MKKALSWSFKWHGDKATCRRHDKTGLGAQKSEEDIEEGVQKDELETLKNQKAPKKMLKNH